MESVNDTLSTIFDSKDSKWKPSEKIPLLAKEIETTKLNLKQFLDNSDYDIKAVLQESNELLDEAKALTRDLELCEEEIEQVTMAEVLQSIENHNHIAKEIQSYTYALNIVKDVIQSSKHVKKFSAGRAARSYSVVTEAIHSLLSLIENSSEGFQELEYCQNLKQDVPTILISTLHEMHSEWRRMVQWQVTPDPSKTIVTLKISLKPIDIAIDILSTLNTCESKLQELVRELGTLILEEILVPIIHKECTVYSETEMDELVTVTIFHIDNFKPTYDAVIANLRLFFHYLNNRLNIEFKKDTTIMKILGKEIYKEFSDILVRDCFINTIPNNITDLQIYGRITSEIQCFQDFLVSMKFFPDENFSILQYVENIDTLFADKSSEHFLNEARLIMFQDLSVTMSIGVENIPEENNDDAKDIIEMDEQTEEALKVLDATIPKSLFYFPRCMISKSTQELLDLVYGIMEQAVQCSDVVSKKLYNTTRLVFELYDAVVPYHHENYLQTIPHYVALFHNNCMYLAHNLQTFGDKWLILMEGRELDYPISFLDLVPKLRDLGYKHLMIHMQQQRKQILDNIRSSDLNCIVVKDLLGDNAEAAVRQCLRQLQLLKNVWIGVFPSNVFLRLMATLVNMFVDELIHRVCTVEDISMEMASQLSEMYSLVVQKAPQLFQSPDAIETHVKSWEKLQQLIFVLGGSLRDIENHWNDGKGPLAVHFKTEELRSLIKALFQNTQIRSNLLSKIKQ